MELVLLSIKYGGKRNKQSLTVTETPAKMTRITPIENTRTSIRNRTVEKLRRYAMMIELTDTKSEKRIC
jgi:hypothetical protein